MTDTESLNLPSSFEVLISLKYLQVGKTEKEN